jgi:hypothetical protein
MSGFDGKDTVRATGGCLVCGPRLCCGDPRWVPHTPNSSRVLSFDIQEQRNVSGAVRPSTEAARGCRAILLPENPVIALRRDALKSAAVQDAWARSFSLLL